MARAQTVIDGRILVTVSHRWFFRPMVLASRAIVFCAAPFVSKRRLIKIIDGLSGAIAVVGFSYHA